MSQTDKNTYAQVYLKLPVPVFLIDFDLQIIDMNPACLEILDLTMPLAQHESLKAFFSFNSDYLTSDKATLKLTHHIHPISFSVQFERLEKFWMGTFISPPIYDTLKTENTHLKAISHRKSELIANLSHELRTPLTAILGWPEIILDSQSQDMAVKAAQAIQKDGEILLGLLEDLIDFSKVEAGKMKIDRRPENLNEILVHSLDILKTQLFNKSIRLNVSLPEDQLIANIDPLRITQVILNFVSNAIKFTPENGLIQVVMEYSDNEAQISIKDSGVGISEAQHQRIFERFVQGDETATTGAGIGLSLVKSLIEMHQGHTWVESLPGEGATFHFTLPFTTLIQGPPKPVLPPPVWTLPRPLNILVLEPHEDNKDILISMLKAPGIDIVTANFNTLEETLSLPTFDCILLESSPINISESLNALQTLQSNPENCIIPTLALSTSAMTEDEEKYLQLGYDAYLSKPFRKQDLLKCLHQLLKKERHV